MKSHEMPEFNENKPELQKMKYVIFDMSGEEPIALDSEFTDDPDKFVEAFEAKSGNKLEENPHLVVAVEDPSPSIEN